MRRAAGGSPDGGRQERFQVIFDDNYELILGYALRRTDTADDAADVVADTFLAAWRRLDDVPEGERARLWLYGAARRVLSNHYRGLRRQRRLADRLRADLPRLVADIPAPAYEGSDTGRIAAAFGRLTPADRDLLILVGWEGVDPAQVADVLGCTRATARVRLHRARKRFTKALETEGVQRNDAAGHEPSRWATARPGTEETL